MTDTPRKIFLDSQRLFELDGSVNLGSRTVLSSAAIRYQNLFKLKSHKTKTTVPQAA